MYVHVHVNRRIFSAGFIVQIKAFVVSYNPLTILLFLEILYMQAHVPITDNQNIHHTLYTLHVYTFSVELEVTLISSTGTCNSKAAICIILVLRPWPISTPPWEINTVPS